MSAVTTTSRSPKSRRVLLAAFGTILVLGLLFCGWVYKAKTRRDLNMQLLGAVRKNDTEAVLGLLARGADPNILDVPQQNLSLWQQIQLAFHHDSPPADDQTDTPKRIVLELALTWDRDIDTDSEEPPFKDTENAVVIKALLDAGARTEDSSQHHQTPLMTAVSRDRLKTVQTLLDHGAYVLARNDDGKLPIHCMNDDFGHKVRIAELLLKHGTDINATDEEGRTPLLNESFYWDGSDLPILSYLLAHGANINAKTKGGCSALLLATKAYDNKSTRFIIEHGADVNVCDDYKSTPLLYTAAHGSVQNVILLLAKGAKIDPIDSNEDTPLTCALQGDGRPDVIKLLIAHGANVKHRNKTGDTALAIAIRNHHIACVRLLKAAGAKR